MNFFSRKKSSGNPSRYDSNGVLDSKSESLRANWKCIAACTLMAMCPFQYGIDFGVIGGLQAMPGFLQVFGNSDPALPLGWNISPVRQQLISSLMVLGAFLSAGFTGLLSKFIGRKLCTWIACLICAVANITMMATTSIGALYFARLLIGLANGLFFTVSQLYIQECSPPRYRGLLINSISGFNSFGTLIGSIIDNATYQMQGRRSYLIPLGTIFIVPAILTLGLFFIPESPRWYATRGETEKARKSLTWLRPKSEAVNDELALMLSIIEHEQEVSQTTSLMDTVRRPVDRRRTLLTIGVIVVQAGSGAFYMIVYATYFLLISGVGSPFSNTCIFVSVGVIAAIANASLIVKFGSRRLFIILGLIMCGITQLIVAVVFDKFPGRRSTGNVIVAMLVFYIIGFNGMISPYSWLLGGEIPSQRLRSMTVGFASATSFFFAWLSTFTAPYFINPDSLNWGPKYGYIWTGSCMACAIWSFLFLPETFNRSFEEISEMFEARVPARKFRHQNLPHIGTHDAREKGDGVMGKADDTHVTHEEVIDNRRKSDAANAAA